MKNVRQVDVPTMSGNMGILGRSTKHAKRRKGNDGECDLFLANHVPILGVLKPGVVSVFESDGNTKRFFGKHSFSTSASRSREGNA